MEIKREQIIVDATDKPLGRLASEIAVLLRGKHKPSYQPHIDGGDIVVVQNVGHLVLTGKKGDQKQYHRYTGYPGGIRTESMGDLHEENPAKLLKMSVRLMLPDNKLRKNMMKRLIIE